MRIVRALGCLLPLLACTPTLGSKLARRGDLKLPLPPAHVDAAASLVVLDGVLLGNVTAQDIRTTVASSIQDYLGMGAAPARFRLVGTTDQTGAAFMWLVPCFVDLIFIGCPVAVQNAHADLELQIGDRTYSGSGEASAWMGLYYNHDTRGVLGEAIAGALKDIAAKAEKR